VGAALARLLRDPAGAVGELKAQFTNDSIEKLLRSHIEHDFRRSTDRWACTQLNWEVERRMRRMNTLGSAPAPLPFENHLEPAALSQVERLGQAQYSERGL
jgi:hypothetical protein